MPRCIAESIAQRTIIVKHKLNHSTPILLVLIILSIILLASCNTSQEPLPTRAQAVGLNKSPNESTATEDTAVPQKETVEATETPTPEPTITPAGTNTPGPTPTKTPLPTITVAPTQTPTSVPLTVPALTATAAPPFLEGIPTPPTVVPTAVATFEVPNDTTNILLLGSDTPLDSESTRTDTMIIVTVNRSNGTASMISLPRDLYVYHPGKTMARLNSAMTLGGIDELKQTILYNFGIPIHYYARIDFDGFKQAVDIIGGVDIAVSCQLRDWRLKSPELELEDPDNWEMYTLPPGVYTMDGDTALWFARSRQSTSDFDRGRRQQQLLRAILNQGVDLNLVTDFPTYYNTYKDIVDTDLDIGRMLQLAAAAPAVRENGVQHLYLARGTESWQTPDGAYVQLPLWEGEGNMQETFSRLFRPPSLNKADRRPIFVEIINATDNPDLAHLAADNLAWYGFIPVISPDEPEPGTITHLSYYKPNFKDSYDWLISWIFDVYRSQIELVEDDIYPFDYRVVLGDDYDPCLNQLYQPQEFIDE